MAGRKGKANLSARLRRGEKITGHRLCLPHCLWSWPDGCPLNWEDRGKRRGYKTFFLTKQFTSTLCGNKEQYPYITWPKRHFHALTLEILIFVNHGAYGFAPLLSTPSRPRGGGDRRLALFTLAISPCNLGNHVANQRRGGAPHAAIHNADPFIFHTIGYLSHPTPCQGDCAPFVPTFWAGVSCPTPSFMPAYVLALALLQLDKGCCFCFVLRNQWIDYGGVKCGLKQSPHVCIH